MTKWLIYQGILYLQTATDKQQQSGVALARGSRGPDPPAAVRDTREIDANPSRKFNRAPPRL